MSTQPFFSIIIPVYNGVTNDLTICLNSIWEQSLDKELYEVICIDDCSTDNTRSWLKEQQKGHNNLVVIENEKNIRQGGARNKGVKAAKGKYILFIDQDDYYHQESLGKIYIFLQGKDLEILVTDSAYQFKNHPHNNLQLNLPYKDLCDGETFVLKNGFAIAPWRLCFNRDFYNKNNIQFEENCRIEDIDWGVTIMFYAKKIQYQPILLIHYIKSESGTTDNMYKNIEILVANTNAANRTYELSQTLYKNSAIKEAVIKLTDKYYYFTCKYMLGLFSSIKSKKEIIKLIKLKDSNYRMVKFAIKHPTIFSFLSNCTVPVFRIARYIRRKRTAKRLTSKTNIV
ncbi:MAG: glycosyltransferase family 2 protein [Bacteroidaceae bacterium]|nr:glycosyltransferase family 2 protein [Bacteroidaceae bacterium]